MITTASWRILVSRILSCIFEGDDINSQMEGYFSVLLFSIFINIIIIIIASEVFQRPSGEDSP